MKFKFFRNWVENGIPKIFWFPGFCFPQAFIAGTLQNYVRKRKIAIDEVKFNFVFPGEEPEDPPKDGVLISGLFLEGAKWNQLKSII